MALAADAASDSSRPRPYLGIRARIIGLVCLTAVPLIGVAVNFAGAHLDNERSAVLERVKSLAHAGAVRLDDELGGIASLLQTLSHAVSVGDDAAAFNDALLARIHADLPTYYNGIAVFDITGRNIGIAPFQVANRDILTTDRDYFVAARAGQELAIGQPLAGPISQRLQVVIANPIRAGDDRAVVGVIAIGVVLEGFARIFDPSELPPETVMRIANDRGIVLARSADAASWVGRNLSNDPWILDHLRSGTAAAEVTWADGSLRLTASAVPRKAPWIVSVGIPASTALSELRESYWQNGLLGGGALALALLVAWAMSGRIAQPIRQLAEDARRFAETDLTHRSTVRSHSEIGLLASTLNAAADMIAEGSRQLRQAGEDMRTIIQASPIPILTVDDGGKVTLWNEAAEQLWGHPAAEVLGKTPPLGQTEDLSLLFRRVIEGSAIIGHDLVLATKYGRKVEARMFAARLSSSLDHRRGAVSLWLDLTEQNELERRLRESQKMQAVGQLAGGIAHDINNVLGVIVANLDLLELVIGDRPEDRALVEAALGSALKGAELVRQLLVFSRQQPLQLRPTDVAASLAAWVPLLRRTLGERVGIELKLDDGLWAATTDPVQLENCVLNLALNARDAMPEGGTLIISARNLRVGDEIAKSDPNMRTGDYVVLSVTDTGCGIAADLLPRVFDPFFTTKEVGKGSGLGLSMVFGHMRQSGGTAKIYSEVGKGTSVQLYLPRTIDLAERRDETIAETKSSPRGSESILVVDDNADMRSASVAMLSGLGYRTTEAADAHAAMAAIDAGGHFDLVFSDVVMPGEIGGIDLARTVRHRGYKVLLTSGFASPVDIHAEAVDEGFAILTKPFRKSDLAASLRTLLDAER